MNLVSCINFFFNVNKLFTLIIIINFDKKKKDIFKFWKLLVKSLDYFSFFPKREISIKRKGSCDRNGIRTYHHLVHKETLNRLAQLAIFT